MKTLFKKKRDKVEKGESNGEVVTNQLQSGVVQLSGAIDPETLNKMFLEMLVRIF